MSNEAQDLLKEIQYKTGKTLQEIADEINYSRPYLNNVKLKGGGGKVVGVLKEKYKKILQNVPRATEEKPKPGKDGDLMPVLVQLMTTQNRILERQEVEVVDRVKNIEASLAQLNPVLAGVTSLSLQIDSARQVALQSLSRLEGKPENQLLQDADKIMVNKMKRVKIQGKHAGIGKERKD